jgi:hypothetical protein
MEEVAKDARNLTPDTFPSGKGSRNVGLPSVGKGTGWMRRLHLHPLAPAGLDHFSLGYLSWPTPTGVPGGNH